MRTSSLTSFLLRAAAIGVACGIALFLLLDAVGVGEAPPRASYREAVRRAAPAVVNIYSAQRVPARSQPGRPLFDEFFGDGESSTRLRTSLGSGVIMDGAGYVITNHHVIAGADRIEVVLADGRRIPAQQVGSDPATDLALLHINADHLHAIRPARAQRPAVGDVVLALGNAYGVGRAATLGIVSATGRDHLGLSTFEDFIQHDAAINPGNSGGPLVDPSGRLVGINTAIFSRSGGSQGVGFAIPTEMVLEVVRQLRAHGRVIRGWLGVRTEALSATEGSGDPPGLRITGVFADGPADRAGLEGGDILLSVAATALANVDTLLQVTTSTRPGTPVELVFRRDGERHETAATLAERPAARQR